MVPKAMIFLALCFLSLAVHIAASQYSFMFSLLLIFLIALNEKICVFYLSSPSSCCFSHSSFKHLPKSFSSQYVYLNIFTQLSGYH